MSILEQNFQLANVGLSNFLQRREDDWNFLTEYLEAYVKTRAENDFLSHQDPRSALGMLIQIFSTAAFIRWKKVTNFERDAISIANELIEPINRILSSHPFGEVQGRRDEDKIHRMAYFPNLHPLGTTAASSVGALGMIETFWAFKQGSNFEGTFDVYARNPAIGKNLRSIDYHSKSLNAKLKIIEYGSYSMLPQILEKGGYETVLYDYFTYPWTFIPFLHKKISFIYISFGFTPCIFRHTGTIVGWAGQHVGMMADYLENRVKNGTLARYVTVPARMELRGESLKRSLESESSPSFMRLKDLRSRSPYLALSLCRHTKVSPEFFNTVCALVDQVEGLEVVLAGPDMTRLRQQFGQTPNVHFFDEVPSYLALSLADLYLETFPEHQGRAALEALECCVPVVSMSGELCNHMNTSERAQSGLVKSVPDYLALSAALLRDGSVRQQHLSEQSTLLRSIFASPKTGWERILGI